MSPTLEAVDWGAILAPHTTYSCVLDPETHIYRVDGEVYESVTQILSLEGMSADYDDMPAAAVEHAGWRGSNVHLATQFLDEGNLDWTSLTDEETGYVQSYDAFLYNTGFTPNPEFTEHTWANQVYRVAGQNDRVGLMRNGDLAVADLKTGALHPSTRLQLAAYGWLIDPSRLFHRFAVKLRADGQPQVTEYPLEEYTRDVSVFLAAVTCVQWRAVYTQKRRPKR